MFSKEEKSKNLTEHLKIDVIPSYSDEKLQEIITEIEAMIKEYEEWNIYFKIYTKFKNLKRSHKSLENEEFAHLFKPPEMDLLEKNNYELILFNENPFPHGYPINKKLALVYDDMVSEKRIFSANFLFIKGKATNLFLNHRHISMTIIMSTQVFKNGIPNAIHK